jgi:NADPH:quinone reductase-like Zn-dependent oxidoreductase
VVALGSAVPPGLLHPGARVVTHLAPHVLPETRLPVLDEINAGLGGGADGTLRRRGAFHWSALVAIPSPADGKDEESVTFEEAATLPCSALTAWNALMGLHGREVREGDWVVVQGSGGVSVSALQVRDL